jgi:hypothetical protein
VDHVGTEDNPWTAVIALHMIPTSDTRAYIRGSTQAVFRDGWANFTDLCITHSGTYRLSLSIANTSIPTAYYEVNVTERPLAGKVISQPYDVFGNDSFSVVVQVVEAITENTVEDLQWKVCIQFFIRY